LQALNKNKPATTYIYFLKFFIFINF